MTVSLLIWHIIVGVVLVIAGSAGIDFYNRMKKVTCTDSVSSDVPDTSDADYGLAMFGLIFGICYIVLEVVRLIIMFV